LSEGVGEVAYRGADGTVLKHISLRRWRVDPAQVMSHAWADEDEQLVYDQRSGHTHMVGPIEAWILNRLTSGPVGVAELVEEFADGSEQPASADVLRQIEAILRRLEDVELAERVAP
jgi:PqqD family protein of HPr-rel-A system